MYKLNLIKLLKIFSHNDLREFDKFLLSPLYNNQNTLVRFFRELRKYHPDFSNKKLNSKMLFKSVNPEKVFNSVLFRKYVSSLTKLAEQYLSISKLSEDSYRMKLILLQLYDQAGLESLFMKKEKSLTESENKKSLVNAPYIENRIWHSEIRYNYYSKIKQYERSLEAITENLVYSYLRFIFSYSNNLRKFYVLKYNYDPAEINKYFKQHFELVGESFFENAENLFSGKELLLFRLFNYDRKISVNDNDENSFKKLRETVFLCTEILTNNMLYYYIARLNIFCLIMTSRNIEGYKQILFENHKYMFNKDLFFSDNRRTLTYGEYISILLSALKVGQFDWAYDFILNCKNNPDQTDSADLSRYGYLNFLFYKGEFKECLNNCSLASLKNITLKIGVSKITLKVMYELGYFDSARSFLSNYKHYLNNSSNLSINIGSREIQFTNYYQILLNNTKSSKKTYLKNIIMDLKSETNIADKDWLMSKFQNV